MLQAPDRSAEGSRGAGEWGCGMRRGGKGALCFGEPGPLSQAVPSTPTHGSPPLLGDGEGLSGPGGGGGWGGSVPAPSQPLPSTGSFRLQPSLF